MRSTGVRTLSIAVVTAAIALLAMAATAAAAPRTIEGGELDWGVKESFRTYVTTMAQEGQIEVSGGATEAADGTYEFPVVSGSYDSETGHSEEQFGGSVRFSAYYAFGGGTPLLDITITDPKVVLEGTVGTLYADVATRNGSTMEIEEESEVDLAELDATGVTPVEAAETVTWESIAATLTADGEPVFGSYPAGEALDPVTILASRVPTPPAEETKPPSDPGPGDPTPASTDTTPSAPAPSPAPAVTMPTLKSTGGSMQVGNGGSATVATLTCPSGGSCTLTAPRTIKVKIGGKTFTAKVIAPHSIAAGHSAKVTVKLPAAALAELAGGKVKISLKLVLGSGAQQSTKLVKATLKAKAS